MSQTLEDLLYEYKVNITGMSEYGTSFADLMAGKIQLPPEGARFDVYFEGPVSGGKMSGTAKGVDYLRFRADGRMELDIHSEITTQDGAKISLKADGVCIPRPDSPVADLKENVTLFSSHKDYTWINPLQIWGVGTVDLAAQVVHIRGYVA
ncbi:MAG: DUF3237 family protein [Chitinophagaceae bacterium]